MSNFASAVRCYQGHYDPKTKTFNATKEIPLCSLRGACYGGDRSTGPVLSKNAAFLYGTGFTLDDSFVPDTGDIAQVRLRDPEDPSRNWLRAVASVGAGKITGVNLPYSQPTPQAVKGVVFSETPPDAESVSYCVLLLSFNSIYNIGG